MMSETEREQERPVRIGVTVLNIKEGGRMSGGGYDNRPAVEVIAADPAYTDLIVICEAKYYVATPTSPGFASRAVPDKV